MLKSNAPGKYTVPFANTGAKNTIPIAPPVTPGLASFQQGFPPVTMEPIGSGGIPPYGQDFNGILNSLNIAGLWQQAGFMFAFDSVFASDSNISGYPAQALLSRTDGLGLWFNTTDGNTTNPDSTGSSGWLSVRANAGVSTIPVVAGSNTPDRSQLGPRLLVVTGSIATATTLVLPLQAGASWLIQNSTTGAGSLTAQGATGTGVTVAQGSTIEVVTDGTNFFTASFNGAGVYLPIAGTAVAATKLATARTIAMTGDVSWTSPGFDGTANVTAAGTISAGAVTFAKMANFAANSLVGNPTGSSATPQAIFLTSGIQFIGASLSLGNITPTSVSSSGNISSSLSIIAQAATFTNSGSECDVALGFSGSQNNGWYLSANSAGFGINQKNGSGGYLRSPLLIDASGNATFVNVVNAQTFNRSSDIRLKDYEPAVPRDMASHCPLIRYTMKNGSPEMVGIVAQDVLAIAPQHVSENDDGLLGVDYGSLAVEQSWANADEIRLLRTEIAEIRKRLT